MSLEYAVPKYVSDHKNYFKDTPPGHRFLLYFQTGGAGWADLKDSKRDVLQAVTGKGVREEDFAKNLVKRQTDAATTKSHLVLCANSTSPIATGLGNPHPVENGFAFISPYGIPYLAGSSVKGVVRRAAEELALFEPDSGWTIPLVWVLFGFDAGSAYLASKKADDPDRLIEESLRWMASFANWVEENADNNQLLRNWLDIVSPMNHRNGLSETANTLHEILAAWIGKKGERDRRNIHWQGLLNFWDVFPETQNGLAVDILNPHHKNYFDGKGTPNDSETPKPVFFLTIPQGAACTFICEMPSVADEKRRKVAESVENWKALMTKAYEHAFDWLGFGAKTAVGYGAMERDANREDELKEETAKKEKAAESLRIKEVAERKEAERLAGMSPLDRFIEEAIKNDQENKEPYLKLIDVLKKGICPAEQSSQVAQKIKAMMIEKGDWIENPDPEKAKKDKKVKRTLEVMKFLEQ